MSIQVQWHDDTRTIVRWDIEGQWSWDDVYPALYEAYALLDTVDYIVHTIVDVRNSSLLPKGTITHLKNLAARQHPRAGITVFVTGNVFAISVFNVITRLSQQARAIFRLAATPEAALALIHDLQPA